jgi:energy-coupling factor transporter ATP-binding protein EcfA2
MTDAPVLMELQDADLAPPGRPSPLLRGLSLRLYQGEIAILLGKNGSGKTTVLRTLAGIWPLRRGTLVPPAPTGFDARRAGLLLEDPASQLVAGKVSREVEFGLENQNLGMEEIQERKHEVFEQFGIAAWAEADPHTLSPGEQEQVLLAAALAPGPPVLLLDDPFLYLGPGEARKAWDRLVGATRAGWVGSVLLASHDWDLAEESDRAGILADGRLLDWGAPKEVLGNAARRSYL